MQRFRVILFDLDGTLLNFEEAERNALSNAFAEFQISCSENTQYLYHEINKRLWEQFEIGLVSKESLTLWRFEELFKELDIHIDAERMNRAYQKALSHCVILEREAREVCGKLSKACKLYIVTNGTAMVQYSRLKESGLEQYFQGVFISEELGAHKPEEAFFEKVFERISCTEADKPEVLLVGDTVSSDIKGALRAGISACWYNPSGKKNYSSLTPHYEIQSLSALLGIVGTCGEMR